MLSPHNRHHSHRTDNLWLLVALATIAIFIALASRTYQSAFDAGRKFERELHTDTAHNLPFQPQHPAP